VALGWVTGDGSATQTVERDGLVELPGNALDSAAVRSVEMCDFGLPVISGTPTLRERAASRE
jgi:hypothetical protein